MNNEKEYFERKLYGNEPAKRLDGKPIFLSVRPQDFHATRLYGNPISTPNPVVDNPVWIPADALPVIHHDYCSNLNDVDGGCDDGSL